MNSGLDTGGGSGLSTSEPSGSFDTPLLDWWMTGAGYEIRGGVKNGKSWKRPVFKGVDVEVIETSDVYPHPTAEFSIFYSDPKNTPKRTAGQGINEWEAFSESLRAFYGDADPFNDLFGGQVVGEGAQPAQLGRRMRIKKVPTLMQAPPDDEHPKWWAKEMLAFKVVEIEGMTAMTPIPGFSDVSGAGAPGNAAQSIDDYLIAMADGKHIDAFYEEAVDDSKVMAQPATMMKLADKQWHQPMVDAGRIKVELDGTVRKLPF